MSDLRIIVTGGRKRGSAQDCIQMLDAFTRETDARYPGMRQPPVTIIQGGCPDGADMWARVLAEECDFKCETVPADFDAHPDDAVEVSNQAMVDRGADLCLAFPNADGPSLGTWDMIRRACAAGIETRIYPEDDHE